ncbi:PD40 domain-containing protein [Engelhardtia mirabilis]|uniref:Translocation protein TolB n=1 Tax=Engelhardtia mirabilis TaxID=2528011 RepID=A0A518BJD9_9BACT|nr:translocation protein TolB [Planctomycetes bacterium Pla133]QDV01426.1 translocation protein TolB [Planctomycetes bacterium Pla86]
MISTPIIKGSFALAAVAPLFALTNSLGQEEAATSTNVSAVDETQSIPVLSPPIPGAVLSDHLIEGDEGNFAHLWMLTASGENAEAYWSFDGSRLSLQRRNLVAGIECDRIYATDPGTGALRQVSDGRGVTTCAYFMPSGREVIYASTGAAHETCPPPPDRSLGYVWQVYPEHDIYTTNLETGVTSLLIGGPGYDAEATVSPLGDRIVFTSTRTGDPELYTCALDGTDVVQITDSPGYDGGAFFSHDGTKLIFRSTKFSAENREAEQAEFAQLMEMDLVRPSDMELMVCDADGSNRRQLTDLGRANWAPFYYPDDSRVIFSSNHHVEGRSRNFDLFSIPASGGEARRVTTYDGFDSFPIFSPDGRWLAFSSNRGGTLPGETNVFIAQWKD